MQSCYRRQVAAPCNQHQKYNGVFDAVHMQQISKVQALHYTLYGPHKFPVPHTGSSYVRMTAQPVTLPLLYQTCIYGLECIFCNTRVRVCGYTSVMCHSISSMRVYAVCTYVHKYLHVSYVHVDMCADF